MHSSHLDLQTLSAAAAAVAAAAALFSHPAGVSKQPHMVH